jgi:hypothetical protein
MKKFTLCALALSGVLLVSAGAPKKFSGTIPAKSVDYTEAKGVQLLAPTKVANENKKVAPFRLNALKAENAAEGMTKAARTVSRADEATESGYKLLYTYPDEALFPIMHLTYAGTEYYSSMGGVLVPANVDVTFPNYTYIYDSTTGASFPEDLDWNWTYYSGVYSNTYMSYADTTSTYNLTEKFTPTKIMSYAVNVPQLKVGTDSVSATYDYTYQGTAYTDAMDMYVGGTGAPNPGYAAYLDSLYLANGYTNINYATMLSNYNAAYTFYATSGTVAAGKTTGSYYTSYSGKEMRNNYLEADLTEAGLTNDDFYGYTQLFSTGNAPSILSTLKFTAYVTTTVEKSATISLYKMNFNDAGTAYTLEQLYSAEQTFQSGTDGWQDFKIELFDEETENEYIALDPSSTYMILISGIDDFDAFMLTTNKFSITPGAYTPEWIHNRGTLYAVYLTSTGSFSLIDADLTMWADSNKTSLVCNPTLSVELGIEYPYIVPMINFTSSTTADYVDAGTTEVDGNLFDIGSGTVMAGEVNTFSNATADELTASIEYSSDALKDVLTVVVASGSDTASSSGAVTWKTAIRYIVYYATGDIPAGSWIKVSYKGATLKVNIPEYTAAGIGSVAADNEAVATQLYDLQGRKIVDGAKGIAIKQVKMADGSVKTTKVAL